MKNSWLVSVAVVVMLLASFSYYYVDIEVVRYFHTLQGSSLEHFFSFVTEFGKAEYVLVPSGLLYLFYRKRVPKIALKGGFVFLSVAVSGILVDIIKAVAGRFRPEMYFKEGAYGFDFWHISHNMTSFPSGHSATALGTAVALALLYPRYRGLFILCGFLIMISRVIVVRHYPSDVFVGAFIGAVISWYLYQYYFKDKFIDA